MDENSHRILGRGGESMRKLDQLYVKTLCAVQSKLSEEKGAINTIEIVVILGIVVALAIVFGGKLTDLFNTWFGKIAT